MRATTVAVSALSAMTATGALVASAAPAALASPPSVSAPTSSAPTSTGGLHPALYGASTGGHGHKTRPITPFARPQIVSHRGASGYRPEHTRAAYELAVRLGADHIEPDLVMTKDGVLVVRHEPEISGTTDIADHPELADRRTTKSLDGKPTTGWFVEDLTLAELRTLRAKERVPELRDESAMYDGRYPVMTFDEVLTLRSRLSRSAGRPIGVVPEIKHSTYLHEQGLDPEKALVRDLRRHGLNRPGAPVWVQSFELTNLQDLRENHRYRAKLVFLTSVQGAPYDLAATGDRRTYADLMTPSSLRELSRWIDALGPEKAAVIPRTADGALGEPTDLVEDAHAARLRVMPWTLRAENTFLPTDLRNGERPERFGRAIEEARAYLDAGVDGIFCDQPDVCVAAREELLAERRAG